MHPLAVVALFEFLAHLVLLVELEQVAGEELIRADNQAAIG